MQNKLLKIIKSQESLFLIGLFLLPSTLSIGLLIIFISTVNTLIKYKPNPLSDKWNRYLLIVGALMILSCIVQSFNFSKENVFDLDISLIWISLFNWIPFFYLFWTSQFFLKTSTQKIKAATAIVTGSIPIVIAGFLQYFFTLNGPLKLFNGIVIWYLKPIRAHEGLSSIFSNQNYAGTWLLIVWPLSLSILLIQRKSLFKKLIAIFILIVLTLSIFLTTSRNAITGLFFAVPFIFGLKIFLIIFLILSSLTVLLVFQNSYPAISELLRFLLNYLPDSFLSKFSKFGFKNILAYTRINLWLNSITLIFKNPFFGYGASFFPIVYQFYFFEKFNSLSIQHSHNIFIELAFNYGIIVSFLIFLFIAYQILKAYKTLKNNNFKTNEEIINKCWLASSIVAVLSQTSDITYYDGRISFMFWFLIAGLRMVYQ